MQLYLLLLLLSPLHCCSAEKTHKVKAGNVDKGKHSQENEAQSILYTLPKDIIVLGGGIAGLAAARKIASDKSNFTVKVYEAQKNRYGGRVWTDTLTNMKAKGPEVDLGASALNVASKSNTLIELIEKFELKTTTVENLLFIVPWQGKTYSGDEISTITKSAVEVLSQALNESRSWKVESSVRDAIDTILKDGKVTDDDSPGAHFVKCLPSYIIKDYSIKNYKAEDLDVGYEKILLDGMGELLDRLVSGSTGEGPLHVDLNKVARQIKVDDKKNKVTVRFRDGTQIQGDMVVVAVPISVIATSDLLFEPDLPPAYRLAAQEITVSKSNKVIVEFEQLFWPADFGVFLRAVQDEEQRGNMQTWINLHKVVGRPVLVTFLIGDSAAKLEAMSEEQVEHAVRLVLSEIFSEVTVNKGGKIVGVQRSHWVSNPYSKGSATYPGIGTDPKLWDTFSSPLCPYIYFAGEHTSSDSHGSLHGAYNSGIRAGDQILTGLCKLRMREEKLRLKEEERKKSITDGAEKADSEKSNDTEDGVNKRKDDKEVKDEL